jgi:hypothetical protein
MSDSFLPPPGRAPRLRNSAPVLARLVLTSLTLVVLLGGLELLSTVGLVDFRVVFPSGGPVPWQSVDNALDPELIHIHKPYLKRVGATRGDLALALHLPGTPLYPYDVAYDRNGFRNPVDLSSAGVAVLGDSFVEGGLVAADDLMTANLGRLLGCTVANLGQSAYGPQQMLTVLKRYAGPLRPRLCIWTFYEGNDLDDAERYEQLARSGLPPGVRSTARERSFGRNVQAALSEQLHALLAPVWYDQAPSGVYRDSVGRPTRLFFRDAATPLSRRDLAALDRVITILADARAACAADGVPLLVVFAPEKFRVYQAHCAFRPENPAAGWTLNDLPERLKARVEALGPGINFLDLTPALESEAAQGRLVYFADDTHWSPAGHQAAARAIAAAIEQHDGRIAARPN